MDDLDQFEDALHQLMRTLSRPRVWELIQREAQVSIDRPSVHLLITLACNTNTCKLTELAALLGIEAPSVTRTVRRLEQDSLVTKTTDPNDRRATYLQITPQGKEVIARIRSAKRKRLKRLLVDWSEKDRALLTTMLQRLVEQANKLERTT